MARPKYQEGQANAKQKLIDAFWDALEKTPFEKITVKQICSLAGVNKNTFYYHFETMEDLARYSAAAIPAEFLPINTLFEDGDYYAAVLDRVNDNSYDKYLRRLASMCGRNGLACSHLIDETFMNMLVAQGGIDPSKFTEAEQVTISMIIGALKANVARALSAEDLKRMMKSVKSSPFPTVFVKSIRDISKRHRTLSEEQDQQIRL